MKPPEEVIRDHVRQWLAKAEAGYHAAEWLLHAPTPIPDMVAFHSQQAAEKYVKALLVHSRIEFPKTHDLDALLDLVSGPHPTVAADLEPVAFLNPFGVKVRYPGDHPELLPGQEHAALQLARLAREAVLGSLGDSTHP